MTKPPIIPVLEHFGFDGLVDYGGWRPVRCVFHGDRRASASYNPDEGLFRCHVCDIGGDAFAVIMHQEGTGFIEAKRRVTEITGLETDAGAGPGHPGQSRLPAWTRRRKGPADRQRARVLRSGR